MNTVSNFAGRLLLAAIFLIAGMWGIDLGGLATEGFGARIASVLVEGILFIAAGYFAWEVVTLLVNFFGFQSEANAEVVGLTGAPLRSMAPGRRTARRHVPRAAHQDRWLSPRCRVSHGCLLSPKAAPRIGAPRSILELARLSTAEVGAVSPQHEGRRVGTSSTPGAGR